MACCQEVMNASFRVGVLGVPKIEGPLLVVLTIRILVYLGLFLGPLFFEKSHMVVFMIASSHCGLSVLDSITAGIGSRHGMPFLSSCRPQLDGRRMCDPW